MPKESEIETRVKEILEVINDNKGTTEIDGVPLTQIIKDLKDEIDKLKKQVDQLEQEKQGSESKLLEELKEIFGEDNFDKNTGKFKGVVATQPPISTKPVDIPSAVEVRWNAFFSERGDITNQNAWKNRGLSIENAEKIYKNGWKEYINAINEKGILNYGNDGVLDTLIINKNHLDTANSLLKEINDPKRDTFQKLPENFKAQEIQDLSNFDDRLPEGKKSTDLEQAIKTRRSTFFYSLHSPEDGGITPEKYSEAFANFQKAVYTPKKYRPLDSKTLNRLFGLEGNRSSPKEVNLDKPNELYNGKSFWENKGGYDMDKRFPGHTDEEKKWGDKTSPDYSPWRLGEHLLRDSYEVNDNWNPDNPVFVEWEEREVDVYRNTDEIIEDLSASERSKLGIYLKDIKREKRKIIKPKQGHLAIGTSFGKTTRLINCLCSGGKRNIILILPNQPLAHEAFDAHERRLQNWGCVYHKLPDGENGQYKSHGPYPVALNDLVHEKTGNEEGDVVMKNGVSILNPNFLLGYLARSLCDIGKIAPSVKGRDRDNPYINSKGEKEWIKQKLIPEDSIIVFDEAANLSDLDYQEIILYTIFLNKKLKYNVILTSATFPDVPFSLNSSFEVNSYEVNYFKSGLNDTLAQQKTFAFVKNIKNIDKSILDERDDEGRTIAYCEFDVPFETACVGISEGMPDGGFMWGTPKNYEMGFTFDIGVVIASGEMEEKNLGAGWRYDKAIVQSLPDASQIQEKGRAGRIQKGSVYFLNTKSLEDEAREERVKQKKKRTTTVAMIKALLSGDNGELKDRYLSLSNVDLLRNALAIPSPLFGQPSEVILIGLNTNSSFVNKPTFLTKPIRVAPNYDKKLWEKHEGTLKGNLKAPKVGKFQAKEIFKLMILTYIRRQKKFPEEVKLEIGSPLIIDADLNEDEVRGVVNSVIKEKLLEIDPDLKIDFNKKKYKESEKGKYDKIIPLLKLAADMDIKVSEKEENSVKKGTLKVDYLGKIESQKRALEGPPLPKIIIWQCDNCDKWNGSNKFCQWCWLKRKKQNNKMEIREDIQVAQVLQEN